MADDSDEPTPDEPECFICRERATRTVTAFGDHAVTVELCDQCDPFHGNSHGSTSV